jgi:hypothetical protein
VLGVPDRSYGSLGVLAGLAKGSLGMPEPPKGSAELLAGLPGLAESGGVGAAWRLRPLPEPLGLSELPPSLLVRGSMFTLTLSAEPMFVVRGLR